MKIPYAALFCASLIAALSACGPGETPSSFGAIGAGSPQPSNAETRSGITGDDEGGSGRGY